MTYDEVSTKNEEVLGQRKATSPSQAGVPQTLWKKTFDLILKNSANRH